MKLEDIPKHVYNDLTDPGKAEFTNAELQSWTPKEVFEKWCVWHGIIGWHHRLWDVVWQLRQKEQPLPKPLGVITDCDHANVYFNRAEQKVICHRCFKELPELTKAAIAGLASQT